MFLYLAFNVGSVVLHQILSPGINNWIANAPLPSMAPEPVAKAACPVCEEGSDDFDACEEKRVACETPAETAEDGTF